MCSSPANTPKTASRIRSAVSAGPANGAAGYRLATLTNGSTAVHKKLYEDAGILDKFEVLLSVEDASIWKPGKAAYDYAASACHTTPDKMLLVAVHPWDIYGASCGRGVKERPVVHQPRYRCIGSKFRCETTTASAAGFGDG